MTDELYSNTFTINKSTKYFDLITRIYAQGSNNDNLELDLHNYFFKFYRPDTEILFKLILKNNDKLSDNDIENSEYIMNGIVFKLNHAHNEIFVSYAGLLMSLKTGDIHNFHEDQNITGLIKIVE